MNFYNKVVSGTQESNKTNVMDYASKSNVFVNSALHDIWGMTKDQNTFLSFMNSLSTEIVDANKVVFPIGDRLPSVLTGTVATYSSPKHTFTMTTATNSIMLDQLISVEITASSNTNALFKVTDIDPANGRFSAVRADGTADSDLTSGITAWKGYLEASCNNYGGYAHDGINFTNDSLFNYTQFSRMSVQDTANHKSTINIGDQSLDHKTKLMFQSFLEQLNTSLLMRNVAIAPTANKDNAIAGGLPYFLKNNTAVGSLSGYYGKNQVINASTFTINDLETYMSNMVEYGSKDRVVVASPAMIQKFAALFRGQITAQKGSLDYRDAGQPNIFTDQIYYDLCCGRLWLLPDRTLSGRSISNNANMSLWNSSNGAASSANTNAAYFLDPSTLKMIYFRDVHGMVQMPKITRVNRDYKNDTTQQNEASAFWSFVMTDPRANGVFSLVS